MEEEVCSFDLALRLKELGVPQYSQWCWISKMEGDEEKRFLMSQSEWEIYYEGEYGVVRIAAFMVGELGEMLPYYFSSEKHSKQWRVGMIKDGKVDFWGAGRKEADARASAKIYLIENKQDHL